MLCELSIENFAIIDRLRVEFAPGFTVLTGETGAGKSIIIDALQAALGARVASDVVRGSRASIEAVFDWPQHDAIGAVLEEAGVEDDESLILRREINASGRTSARINGRTVPSAILAEVGARLVDIHGQSEHLSIFRRDRQLEVLDRYGALGDQAAGVGAAIREYTRLRRELEHLSAGQREAERRLDLLRFQVNEIEGAELRPDEEDLLIAERNLLANAERLAALSSETYETLQGEAGGVLDTLYRAVAALREVAAIDPAMTALAERLGAAEVELEDISQETRHYRDRIDFDPERLNAIEERLDAINRLKRKYGATLADVIAFGEEARAEMEKVEHLDEYLADVAAQAEAAEARAGELAAQLSAARVSAAASLTDAMKAALTRLELRGTTFEVRLEQEPSDKGLLLPDGRRSAWNHSGIDTVSFLVSFNPGEPARPIEKVASGGETSRFLLALKSVLAEADQTGTLIFDEVDTGVGGRRGAVVGERMRELARSHQVICVSHLPQVAALADCHLTVAKAVQAGRTVTEVRELETAERVAEIAEMLTGAETATALQNARELLEAAQKRG